MSFGKCSKVEAGDGDDVSKAGDDYSTFERLFVRGFVDEKVEVHFVCHNVLQVSAFPETRHKT
jgi:hypothetical protein